MSRDSYYLKRDRSLTKDVVPWDDDFAWDKLVNAGEFDAATAVKAFEHIENKNIEDIIVSHHHASTSCCSLSLHCRRCLRQLIISLCMSLIPLPLPLVCHSQGGDRI